MGKRIDDLPLDDTPLATGGAPLPDPAKEAAARETPWSEVLTEIDDLLSTGRYNWARETLDGIYEHIERTHHVSVAQRVAIENISAGGRRSRGRSSANYFRRYQ